MQRTVAPSSFHKKIRKAGRDKSRAARGRKQCKACSNKAEGEIGKACGTGGGYLPPTGKNGPVCERDEEGGREKRQKPKKTTCDEEVQP